jgi:hypothetical protein
MLELAKIEFELAVLSDGIDDGLVSIEEAGIAVHNAAFILRNMIGYEFFQTQEYQQWQEHHLQHQFNRFVLDTE